MVRERCIICSNIADEPFSVGDEEFYDVDISVRFFYRCLRPIARSMNFMQTRSTAGQILQCARPIILAYRPTILAASPTILAYRPTILAARPTILAYRPTILAYRPTIPAARHTFLAYRPTIPVARPTIPAYRPTILAARPTILAYTAPIWKRGVCPFFTFAEKWPLSVLITTANSSTDILRKIFPSKA